MKRRMRGVDMVRAARFLESDGCYYIRSRSFEEQRIFYSDMDYQKYIQLLSKYKTRFNVSLYGFCLMTRSIHLVVHIKGEHLLSKFMQGVNQSYALFFIKRYKRMGKVWGGRYKSILITQDEDLFDCIKFLEFLPVKAKLVYSPVHYAWSSCSYRVCGQNGLVDSLPPAKGTFRNMAKLSVIASGGKEFKR